MIFEVLSLFPDVFSGFLNSSIIARAREKKLLEVNLTDYRQFSLNKHHKVDDYPYGGFAGMVIQAQPIYSALIELLEKGNAPVVYFTPQGRPLTQKILESYSSYKRIILLCGHYKEIDQRVRDLCVSDEISLGDYVLTGGEIPALAFIDGVSRLLPGVLSDLESANSDSFCDKGLGFPCYTRPEIFLGLSVPEVLLSGNHKEVMNWALEQGKHLTVTRRPDLKN